MFGKEDRMAYQRKPTTKDIMTEDQIQKWMVITSDQLKDLRNKRKFPFVSITTTKRMYWVEDVVNWLNLNRTNIPE